MKRIMLVDDDVAITEALRRVIRKRREDWIIETFADPEKALRALRVGRYNVIVSDYCMTPINGAVFLKESRVFQRDAMRIVLSGQAQVEGIISAINEAEIYRYVTKPVNTDELIAAIEQALSYQTVLMDNERLANMVRRQKAELKRARQLLATASEKYPDVAPLIWTDDDEIRG